MSGLKKFDKYNDLFPLKKYNNPLYIHSQLNSYNSPIFYLSKLYIL